MSRASICVTLACALLTFSLGCGGSSHLQSIQLTYPPSATEGFDVINLGGTLQLIATGTYSDGRTHDLTNEATYQITITPNSMDQNGNPLPMPPQGLAVGPTGLLTAEYPGVCTWVNLNASSSTATMPAWEMTGSYTITATDHRVTSPPVYVAVASAIGIIDRTNMTGACGPQPASE